MVVKIKQELLTDDEYGQFHQDTSTEEHNTILSEPGNKYVGHVIPSTGKAKDISREIIDVCHDHDADLKAVGADGARVNTGINNGCIRLLELEFMAPLHWFICQLHSNELPLRHIFQPDICAAG